MQHLLVLTFIDNHLLALTSLVKKKRHFSLLYVFVYPESVVRSLYHDHPLGNIGDDDDEEDQYVKLGPLSVCF